MKKKWILNYCDLDLSFNVTNFYRVRASVVSNHLVKTASESVHPLCLNFVHKQSHTHTQINSSENITPPQFCEGVKNEKTRGQCPNESQKAVIIYMMKSVGEIASKMWPVV